MVKFVFVPLLFEKTTELITVETPALVLTMPTPGEFGS